MWLSVIAISIGASCGAVLRWVFGLLFNTLPLAIPMGTLLANLLGGYLIGVSVEFFSQHAELSPQWRLLVITGFLGGLTTFSTFSAEVTDMLQKGLLGVACATILVHLVGSLAMTFLGIYTYQISHAS
ncbi:MAG: fluoride efflux transporter CrcB [Betaproteobacteria bacterium]|jgi:CrcB protein